MTSHELGKRLLEMKDVPVMYQGDDRDGGPFMITKVQLHVAGEDEYPEDFDMPAGFEFAELTF